MAKLNKYMYKTFRLYIIYSLVTFLIGIIYLAPAVANQDAPDPARLNATRDSFVIELGELNYNNVPLPLPSSAQTWIDKLGQPTETIVQENKITQKKTTLYVWAPHGLVLFCDIVYSDISKQCDNFNLSIRPSHVDSDEKNVHTLMGTLTLEKLSVTKDTKISDLREQLVSTDRFLFGGDGSYFYNVCGPKPKVVWVISINDRKSIHYKKMATIMVGTKTFNDKQPCQEKLSTPYQSVTEAMAYGLFEQAKLYVNEKGECDRACVEKRTAVFKQFLKSVQRRAKESTDSEEKGALQQLQSIINQLKNLDESEQKKQNPTP